MAPGQAAPSETEKAVETMQATASVWAASQISMFRHEGQAGRGW